MPGSGEANAWVNGDAGGAPEADFPPGTVLDRRYRLEALLGRGGMGAVYRAEQVFTRRQVAVKVLHPRFARRDEYVERFRREAELAVRVRSPHVVEVLDFGHTDSGRAYLAMELLAGESLSSLLAREGALSAARAAGLLGELLRGLAAVHAAGIVHRDLKPENLWLAPDGHGGTRLVLLDFGIAKSLRTAPGAARTQVGTVIGTPKYLSPEQALGQPVDARADLYAVGIIAFVLLTGRHPFPDADTHALLTAHVVAPMPRLPIEGHPELVDFVERSTRKNPAERAQSAEELLALVDRGFASESATAVRQTRLLAKPAKSFRIPAFLGAAAVALAVLGGWWTSPTWQARRAIDDGQYAAALAALKDVEADADVQFLRGRALHGLHRTGEGLAAYAAAAEQNPSVWARDEVLADLMDDLAGSRSKEATDRLVAAGARAVDALAKAATDAKSYRRRWAAIDALRRLGHVERADLVQAYVADLSHDSCDVVTRACRKLGELGDRRALEPLQALAAQPDGFFGPCGVAAAKAAVKKLAK